VAVPDEVDAGPVTAPVAVNFALKVPAPEEDAGPEVPAPIPLY
jgi:hypothetical protein